MPASRVRAAAKFPQTDAATRGVDGPRVDPSKVLSIVCVYWIDKERRCLMSPNAQHEVADYGAD